MIVQLIPIVILLSLALSGLGLLIATFMTSQQGFQLVIQLLIFPLIFLAGVFFPVNNVPDWMALISKLNPVTYGVDAIRQIFLGPVACAGRDGARAHDDAGRGVRAGGRLRDGAAGRGSSGVQPPGVADREARGAGVGSYHWADQGARTSSCWSDPPSAGASCSLSTRETVFAGWQWVCLYWQAGCCSSAASRWPQHPRPTH